MGLAATQTRFLSLTARKSNIEYQGQQINQQRTVLANKSANAYSAMLTLTVPVPPSTADFTVVKYTAKEVDGTQTYDLDATGTKISFNGTEIAGTVTEKDIIGRNKTFTSETGKTYVLTPYEEVDNNAYEDAYNQYLYKQYLYEQELQSINAKTEIVQQQDKALDLKLSQLDTEQSEVSSELEALDKVLGDHVEGSYKTFGG